MNDQHSFFAAFEEKQKRRLAYLSNDFTTADDLKKRAEDVAWYADGSESLCYILREAGMDELKPPRYISRVSLPIGSRKS